MTVHPRSRAIPAHAAPLGGYFPRTVSYRRSLRRNSDLLQYDVFLDRPGSPARPGPEHPKHAPMLRELRRIFDACSVEGRVGFEYKTRLYFGRLRLE